jgi:hypothetical protein
MWCMARDLSDFNLSMSQAGRLKCIPLFCRFSFRHLLKNIKKGKKLGILK